MESYNVSHCQVHTTRGRWPVNVSHRDPMRALRRPILKCLPEGQTVSSSTPTSAGEGRRWKPTKIIWVEPSTISLGSTQMGRCKGPFRCVCFQASNSKEGNLTALRQTSQAGCPKPRASHRFPNFRNQAGICLTKINLVPNIYFCHYFRIVWRGRVTQAGTFYMLTTGVIS